ncbi:MAG: hypothetical protein AVDCRST_MAG76-3750, partial [uncultured Acidimicrobiales bacterium]
AGRLRGGRLCGDGGLHLPGSPLRDARHRLGPAPQPPRGVGRLVRGQRPVPVRGRRRRHGRLRRGLQRPAAGPGGGRPGDHRLRRRLHVRARPLHPRPPGPAARDGTSRAPAPGPRHPPPVQGRALRHAAARPAPPLAKPGRDRRRRRRRGPPGPERSARLL